MDLPDTPDFGDAIIEQVTLGPRRELLLSVQLLPKVNGATRSPAIAVRFGGIVNFDEVKAFFAVPHYEQSEIGSIRYFPARQLLPSAAVQAGAFLHRVPLRASGCLHHYRLQKLVSYIIDSIFIA